MKRSRDHVLTWGYRRYFMLTVDEDIDRLRLKVISSGMSGSVMSVAMKIDAKVCFPRWAI
jgi:hypothetical protein